MTKFLFILALFFILVRGFTILEYREYFYYYEDYSTQFAIADAVYNKGFSFSQDAVLFNNINKIALYENKYIPLENWKNYPGSGKYTVFPARDLPGFGYLIAWTSKFFDHQLTSRYAFGVQLAVELFSLLVFVYCCSLLFNKSIGFIAGLLYIFAYPFIWPIATQPTRDMFELGVFIVPILSIFLFAFKKDRLWFLFSILLITLASVMLWIRPLGYYYIFLLAPLIFFIKTKSLKQRFSFFAAMMLIPFLIFGIPYKIFNWQHYGVVNTHVLGRGLWEGLGVVENNPYGFVYRDTALVPFVKKYFHKDVEYSSPEMNKLVGDYAFSVLKHDPGYYWSTVKVRFNSLVNDPLVMLLPDNTNLKFLMSVNGRDGFWLNYGSRFFYVGIIAALIMLVFSRLSTLYIVILLSPLFYMLLLSLGLQFEARTLAKAAWVLTLPIAWSLVKIYQYLGQAYKFFVDYFDLDAGSLVKIANTSFGLKKKNILTLALILVGFIYFIYYPIISPVLLITFKDNLMQKTYGLNNLTWANAVENTVTKTPVGIHVLANNSTGSYQIMAPVLVHHSSAVYIPYLVTVIKGGITIGLLDDHGMWLTEVGYGKPGKYNGFLYANTKNNMKLTIVLANNNGIPQQSDFTLNDLIVYFNLSSLL